MRRIALFAVATMGVLGLSLGSSALADPLVGGTYKLSSRKPGGGSPVDVKVWLVDQPDGSVRVVRQEQYSDGTKGQALSGTGTVDANGWVRVRFNTSLGLSNMVDGSGNPIPAGTYRATYHVRNDRIRYGDVRVPDRNKNTVRRYESGGKVSAEPLPGEGSNPGGGGGGGTTPTDDLASLGAQVVRIDPVGTVDISDVGDTVFARALGAQAPTTSEPLALLKDKKLTLRVFIAGTRSPASPKAAKLTGAVGSRVLFSKDVQLSSLTGSGQEVSVESSEAISAKVQISDLDVAWKLDQVAIGNSRLRVYTIHATPTKNIPTDPTQPATKRHLENACRWANGASKNIGQGADSIGYQIDNQMRHYVHWSDLGNLKPAVPDYAPGAAKPKNYDDLEGYVSNGTRSISSLYYPPLEPTKDYEQYSNFASNFGWQVLDNPNHTGGRCNQQASLVCSIGGTLGIKGSVHYLQRTGRGRTSGRPVRNYFYAQGDNSNQWNFHGVALLTLDDGSQWIYDGSFSFPPNRKNGTKEWAENAGGPFVGRWGDWYYEDYMGGKVPASDIPTTWQGVQ